MPNLIKPGDTKIITKDGEVFVNIALELTVKLDGNNLSIQSNTSEEQTSAKKEKAEEKIDWVVPSFKNKKKIKFGESD